MANSYVITSYTTQGNTTYLGGAVNGVQVNIDFPSSTTFANVIAFQNFVAPLMLAAVPPPVSPATPLATSFSL